MVLYKKGEVSIKNKETEMWWRRVTVLLTGRNCKKKYLLKDALEFIIVLSRSMYCFP